MGNNGFADKVALVTGAASGIGEACAAVFAERGAKVMVADFDEARGQAVAAGLGDRAAFFRVDVADPDQVSGMVEETVRRFGGLHVAVNNAGVGGALHPTGEYPTDAWRRVIAVNLDGVFYCLRAEIAHMTRHGGGAIVNMASILGQVGFANAPAYVAAKHGVVGLTKTAALEVAQQGVRVNSVGPGFIETPMVSGNLDEEALVTIRGLHALGRMGTAREVANLVAFLCSDEASFLTGGYYLVDGGYTAR